MAGTNDFLPFSNAVGANVVTQAAYASDPATPVGFASGVALSSKLNKVWRQSSVMAAALGQLIADVGLNAADDGVVVTVERQIALAMDLARYSVDTGSANASAVAYLPAVTLVVDGMVLRYKAAATNTGATTLNVNGLGILSLIGTSHLPLQGGEIVINGEVWVQYNAAIGAWVLLDATGGAKPVATGTKSNQAVNLGQFSKFFNGSGYQVLPSGLIIQWISSSAAAGGTTFAFPITFPNAVMAVLAGINPNNTPVFAVTYGNTASGTNAAVYNVSGVSVVSNITIFAIGY